MSRVLHRASTGTHDAPLGCHDEPPVFECPERSCVPCDTECGEKCPPKTRARDSEAIRENEHSRCVSLKGRGCQPKQLPAFMHCIEMRIRKKGSCKVLTTEIPYKATYTGEACFNWSNRFKRLEDGYYEGDIYINGKSCISWAFHIHACYVTMETTDIEYLHEPCSDVECASSCGCSKQCTCSKPPLEIEIGEAVPNCGGCEEC